jgi:hypothetical protein
MNWINPELEKDGEQLSSVVGECICKDRNTMRWSPHPQTTYSSVNF